MSTEAFDAFPDAEDLLAGLPARRANALIFLIESRTARLVAQSRQAMERFLTEEAAQERALAFLEAFALAREPPIRPAIQDLERYASQWAPLVPDQPRVRAAVAHGLGEKHDFTYDAVPGIRAALGLDEPTVRQAYERLYREPLEGIFSVRRSPWQRARWAWTGLSAWLENLPPFWTAYSLTLTETVGASILALPIAVAAIGPAAGLIILVVLGLVNVLTVALMAEAVARSGTIRFGGAFFGRLVSDYLGRGGSLVMSASLFLFCLLVLLVYYIGFATTLEDATRVPAVAFVALLFLVGLSYLRRPSLNAAIATALVVGATNIGLVVALSLLAFGHAEPGNLLEGGFFGGQSFDSSLFALIFGVILAAYFGHTSVAICGQLVLRRDPSARALIWGCAAAQATALALYALFVLSVNGAVAPERLAEESGTALAPLAEEAGPAVHVLGSAFVILGMGMASITFTLALFNLTRERLPSAAPRVVTLGRRRGRLVLRERAGMAAADSLLVGVTYLGREGGQPRLRLDIARGGRTVREDVTTSGFHEVLGSSARSVALERIPELREHDARLALEVVGASEQDVRLRVTSTMRVDHVGEWDTAGLHLGDVLSLPDSHAELVAWMLRHGEVTLADVIDHAPEDEITTRQMLESLVEQGLVGERMLAGEGVYAARIAVRPGGRLPRQLSDALVDHGRTERAGPSPGSLERLREALLRDRWRFALSASPVAAAFLVAEWMALTGSGSFAGLLSFVGVIAVSILAGVFPVLLLISSRRKGEYAPRAAYRLLGNRAVLASIYVLFVASILLHGLVIWDGLLERGAALVAGVLIVGMTIVIARGGAFARRFAIQIRDDQAEGRAVFGVTAAGDPVTSDVSLEYPEGVQRLAASSGDLPRFASLRRLTFEPWWSNGEGAANGELKVWAHRITPEAESAPLPARVHAEVAGDDREFDLELTHGQVVLPVRDLAGRVAITLSEAKGTEAPERGR